MEAHPTPTVESSGSQERVYPRPNALIAVDVAKEFHERVSQDTRGNEKKREARLQVAQDIYDMAVDRALHDNPELFARAKKAYKDGGEDGYHNFLGEVEAEAREVREARKVSLDALNKGDLEDLSRKAGRFGLGRKEAIQFLLGKKRLDIASNAEKRPEQRKKNDVINSLLSQDPAVAGLAILMQTAEAKSADSKARSQALKPLAKPTVRAALERMVRNRTQQDREKRAAREQEVRQITQEVDAALPKLDDAKVAEVVKELPTVEITKVVSIEDPKLEKPVSDEATRLHKLKEKYDTAYQAVQKDPGSRKAKGRLARASKAIHKMMMEDAHQDTVGGLYKRHLRAAFLESFNPANLPQDAVREGQESELYKQYPEVFHKANFINASPDYIKQAPGWEEKVFVDNAKSEQPKNIFDNRNFRDIYSMYYHAMNGKPGETGLSLDQHKMILQMDPMIAKYHEARGLATIDPTLETTKPEEQVARNIDALKGYQGLMDVIVGQYRGQLFPDETVLNNYEAAKNSVTAKMPAAIDTLDPQNRENLMYQLRYRMNFGMPDVWQANKGVFAAAMKRYQELRQQIEGRQIAPNPDASVDNRVSLMPTANDLLRAQSAASGTEPPDAGVNKEGATPGGSQPPATEPVDGLEATVATDTIEPEKPKEDPKKIIDRLNRWVSERGIVKWQNGRWQNGVLITVTERGARRQIKNAAVEDLENPLQQAAYEKLVEDPTMIARHAIDAAIIDGSQLRFDHKDSVTGETYTTQFRKEPDGTYVAEEVRTDGSIISRAKIGPKKETTLTLNYTGQHYEGRNPDITNDHTYPRATVKVFNLLAQELISSLSKVKSASGNQTTTGTSPAGGQPPVPVVAAGEAAAGITSPSAPEARPGGEAGPTDATHLPERADEGISDTVEAHAPGNNSAEKRQYAEQLSRRAVTIFDEMIRNVGGFSALDNQYVEDMQMRLRHLNSDDETIRLGSFSQDVQQLIPTLSHKIKLIAEQEGTERRTVGSISDEIVHMITNLSDISKSQEHRVQLREQAISTLRGLLSGVETNRSQKREIRAKISSDVEQFVLHWKAQDLSSLSEVVVDEIRGATRGLEIHTQETSEHTRSTEMRILQQNQQYLGELDRILEELLSQGPSEQVTSKGPTGDTLGQGIPELKGAKSAREKRFEEIIETWQPMESASPREVVDLLLSEKGKQTLPDLEAYLSLPGHSNEYLKALGFLVEEGEERAVAIHRELQLIIQNFEALKRDVPLTDSGRKQVTRDIEYMRKAAMEQAQYLRETLELQRQQSQAGVK